MKAKALRKKTISNTGMPRWPVHRTPADRQATQSMAAIR